MTYGLGAYRQRYDHRDIHLSPAGIDWKTFPSKVDMRHDLANPPIWNQGTLGACTAFASNRLRMFAYIRDGWHNPFVPSHLFQYYNSRALEGTTGSDSGATLRDALKASATKGMTADTNWPYSDANPGLFLDPPPPPIYENAERHLTSQYQAVPQFLSAFKGCLGQGFPFVIGVEVYESFFNAPGGNVPLPGPNEAIAGGHAICVVGFDDSTQLFTFANSWGEGWGDGGYGTLPYAYLTNPSLAYDAWTIRVQH